MDSDTASRFVSSLVKSIQALCNGYIDFSTSIEVVGHIHLRIDHNHKFNYVLSEEVSKSVNEGSTIFSSHSYHSLPPPSAPPTKLAPTSTGGPSSRRKSSHPLPRQEETDPMPVSLPPEVPSRSKELVSDRLSESGDSSHSLSMVVFPEIDELTGSGKPHSNTSGGRTRTISHTQDTLDRRRKSETHAPRSVDSPAKRSRDEESGSVQKTEFEVIEIKEEPGLDEPSCAFSESNQLPSHQAGMGHTPDFSNCVMESLDRVGQIEGTSLLSASDGQQLHLASHQGQSDQPFPVMLHANPSVQAPGGVLTLPGPSNSQATASTTPGGPRPRKSRFPLPCTSQQDHTSFPLGMGSFLQSAGSFAQDSVAYARSAVGSSSTQGRKENMVQLAPGHDVYIDKRQLDKAIEASKINETSLDGCRLARRLLSIMFLPQQRMFGSLSEHPAPGLTQLDPTITNAIIDCCLSMDRRVSKTVLKTAMTGHMCATRSMKIKRLHLGKHIHSSDHL
ncbi:uncharacterized protein LOC112564035 isoform X5 [Pomacea canaliculata]|uniref:uncharacterized protein LOC112564035 isoform X5 n=1 Tax=Pomacea canaliculata TaxID=400727 RepID=UPI000D733CF1|nr:uncharacterized protein LOC112564035 isoform X5 [Pomacea canaliculata]